MKIFDILTENTEEDDYVAPDRRNLHFKNVTDRIPQLTAAAEKLRHGEIDKTEYRRLVNKYKPVSAYDELPPSADDDTMYNTLKVNQRDKLNTQIPAGTPVKLRLDIPAYKSKGVWIPTIHNASGDPISHASTAIIKNVTFEVPEKGALNIARGRSDKGKKVDKNPLATMNGLYIPSTVEQARLIAQDALSNPEWVQVGMDPERHSYFYDRKTQEPVVKADLVIQIGGLVMAKNVTYGDEDDYMYEIYESIDKDIAEAMGNGSFFRYGPKPPKGPNDFHPCVDANDPNCPGHKAGLKYQLGHPHDPLSAEEDMNHPSFRNGRQQAQLMQKRGWKAIGPTISRDPNAQNNDYLARQQDTLQQPIKKPS